MLNENTMFAANSLYTEVMSGERPAIEIVDFWKGNRSIGEINALNDKAIDRMTEMALRIEDMRSARVRFHEAGKDVSKMDEAIVSRFIEFAKYGYRVFNGWNFYPYGKRETDTRKRLHIDSDGVQHSDIDVVFYLLDIAIQGKDTRGDFRSQVNGDTAVRYYKEFAGWPKGFINEIQMDKGRRLAALGMRRAKAHKALELFATLYPNSDVAQRLDVYQAHLSTFAPVKGETEAAAIAKLTAGIERLRTKLQSIVNMPTTLPEFETGNF